MQRLTGAIFVILLCAALLPGAIPCARAAVFMERMPGRYQSASDSPYFAQLQAGKAFLNDFSQDQDGYYWVNSAGQTVWNEYTDEQFYTTGAMRWQYAQRIFSSAIQGGEENGSVDGDDGLVDGRSTGHWGLGPDGIDTTRAMDIYFNTNTYVNSYPLWVGFVMTTNGGIETESTSISILGLGGSLLATFSLDAVKAESLALSGFGQPAEFRRVFNDRALFFHSDQPITRLVIDPATILVDHVQWGYSPVYVPEPGGAALAGAAVLLGAGRRRRAARLFQ